MWRTRSELLCLELPLLSHSHSLSVSICHHWHSLIPRRNERQRFLSSHTFSCFMLLFQSRFLWSSLSPWPFFFIFVFIYLCLIFLLPYYFSLSLSTFLSPRSGSLIKSLQSGFHYGYTLHMSFEIVILVAIMVIKLSLDLGVKVQDNGKISLRQSSCSCVYFLYFLYSHRLDMTCSTAYIVPHSTCFYLH